MNENFMPNTTTKCPWRIKALAIFLIVFFGLATIATICAFLFKLQLGMSGPQALLATVTNLGFVIGGVCGLPWAYAV
jgi:hypothetical protein